MTLKQRDLWVREHAIEKRVFTAENLAEYREIEREVKGMYSKIWGKAGKWQRVENYNMYNIIENIKRG
jgi:hypothetical protein